MLFGVSYGKMKPKEVCINMMNFQKLTTAEKSKYDALLFADAQRGCEYSFANMYLWGRQLACFTQGNVALFSHFHGKSVYPYPLGPGDKRELILRLLDDSRKRGIPFRMTGLLKEDVEQLQSWFPGDFFIRLDRDSFDYVYDINDLADLKGRKFQKKRNHVNRFKAEHPDYRVEPLTRCNLGQVQNMVNDWYQTRMRQNPEGNYLLENLALAKAFRQFEALDMKTLVLFDGDEVLAVTMGSRLNAETFDIHFEKAREDVEGAYPTINQEFARYLREKYPEVKYLNREDDLGIEGLRKAKLSYNPHHMVEKYWVCYQGDLNED